MIRMKIWRTLKIMGLTLAILSLDLIWPDLNLIPILTVTVIAIWAGCHFWLKYMGWSPPSHPHPKADQPLSHLFSIMGI
jgi:hypothetical protein